MCSRFGKKRLHMKILNNSKFQKYDSNVSWKSSFDFNEIWHSNAINEILIYYEFLWVVVVSLWVFTLKSLQRMVNKLCYYIGKSACSSNWKYRIKYVHDELRTFSWKNYYLETLCRQSTFVSCFIWDKFVA